VDRQRSTASIPGDGRIAAVAEIISINATMPSPTTRAANAVRFQKHTSPDSRTIPSVGPATLPHFNWCKLAQLIAPPETIARGGTSLSSKRKIAGRNENQIGISTT
jgi:hypothetical protein